MVNFCDRSSHKYAIDTVFAVGKDGTLGRNEDSLKFCNSCTRSEEISMGRMTFHKRIGRHARRNVAGDEQGMVLSIQAICLVMSQIGIPAALPSPVHLTSPPPPCPARGPTSCPLGIMWETLSHLAISF